jgi:hypothetical protein
MAESAGDFKAFVFSELAELHRGLAEHARATKVRKTESDAESTNSGASSGLSYRSNASGEEIFATPLSEQPPEVRPLLEKAVALVRARVWTRSTCQRYFTTLRQHYEAHALQPARVETLSFLQLQELCGKLQVTAPKDYKDMPAARAAISKKCVGVAEYFVTRYLAEQTARSAAFLAEQTDVLGCGAVVQHTSRAVVTTAMVISPVVFHNQVDGRCVLSLCYRTISLDDEGFGYAKAIKKVLLEAAPPRALPALQMWTPSGDLAQEFEAGARKKECFMKTAELQQLAAEVGVPSGSRREQIIDALAAWASKACLAHLQAQLCGESVCEAAAPGAGL